MTSPPLRNWLRTPPGERLVGSRYLLLLAAAALLGATALWDVPLAYSLAALALLALAAAFAAPRRAGITGTADAAGAPRPAPEAAMREVLDALPRSGFILDRDGVVRYANRLAMQLFPATREGDPFTFTFRWPEIAAAMADAQSGQPRSVEFHEPGERSSVYSVTFSPLPREHGGGPILVVFEDVSDRLAIARMRADFVANASHEMRTPLASLTGFIETLLGPARSDPEATEKFLKIMLDQARRMRRLIDDLLSLSRVEMRVHQRPTGTVELIGVLRHVRDALGPLAAEHGVAVDILGPDEVLAVVGERDELVQVFQNLVENAIRYGGSGGRVEITPELRGGDTPGRVAVHVRDFGPGIAPEHLPRLTERFYRVDPGTSRALKGTGLGLAIVKHIIARHQGGLDIRSRPGEGACFTVDLPRPAPSDG